MFVLFTAYSKKRRFYLRTNMCVLLELRPSTLEGKARPELGVSSLTGEGYACPY